MYEAVRSFEPATDARPARVRSSWDRDRVSDDAPNYDRLIEAVALHRGRSTQVWQTTVTNADGKLCAVVTQTQLILSPQPA